MVTVPSSFLTARYGCRPRVGGGRGGGGSAARGAGGGAACCSAGSRSGWSPRRTIWNPVCWKTATRPGGTGASAAAMRRARGLVCWVTVVPSRVVWSGGERPERGVVVVERHLDAGDGFHDAGAQVAGGVGGDGVPQHLDLVALRLAEQRVERVEGHAFLDLFEGEHAQVALVDLDEAAVGAETEQGVALDRGLGGQGLLERAEHAGVVGEDPAVGVLDQGLVSAGGQGAGGLARAGGRFGPPRGGGAGPGGGGAGGGGGGG